MEKRLLKKGIVLGIIMLFVGASVVPTISGTLASLHCEKVRVADRASGYSSVNVVPLNGWYVQWSHTYGGYGHSQLAQPVGDIDEDGMNEVIVGGYGSEGAHILSYNKNSGEYDEEYFWNYPGGWFNGVPSGACVVDLDNNGELELVCSFEYGSSDGVHAYEWDGETLTELDYYNGVGYDFAFDVYACDYDDDGDVEVLIANSPLSSSGYQVTALRWDTANSEFVREVSWGSGLSTECPMIWSGDPDDDGKTEVIAAAGSNTVYALNYDNGVWNAEVVATDLPSHPYGIGVGDLDNDGIDEIGVGTYGTHAYIFKWVDGSYEEVWYMNYVGEHNIIEGVAVGDADNDGHNEFLVGTDHIHVISYDGTSYVEESTITYTQGMLAGVNIEDFDTDGLNEVKACDIIDGPGKEWIIKHEEPVPDLDCTGSLSWTDVEPGDTVTGEFAVSNIGDSGSLLDWEIESYPEWGTWTFDPDLGEDLTPEAGIVTVEVEVVAPDEPETEFEGEIKIENTDDPDDYCIIPVSLVTPVSKTEVNSQLLQFLQRFIEHFPLLEQILESGPVFNKIFELSWEQ